MSELRFPLEKMAKILLFFNIFPLTKKSYFSIENQKDKKILVASYFTGGLIYNIILNKKI